jgi:hypothetical protein
MTEPQLLPLSTVPGELRYRYGCSVTYRRLYMAVLDGRAEAIRLHGRWFVHTESLEALARSLAAPSRAEA